MKSEEKWIDELLNEFEIAIFRYNFERLENFILERKLELADKAAVTMKNHPEF